VLQKYEVIPAGPHNCVAPPWQKVRLPEIEQGGGLGMITVVEHVDEHDPFVTVRKYVPAPAVIHCVVAPVLQKYEVIPAGPHNCVNVLPHGS